MLALLSGCSLFIVDVCFEKTKKECCVRNSDKCDLTGGVELYKIYLEEMLKGGEIC